MKAGELAYIYISNEHAGRQDRLIPSLCLFGYDSCVATVKNGDRRDNGNDDTNDDDTNNDDNSLSTEC